MMYFDRIKIFKEEPELNHVGAYCTECGKINAIDVDDCNELVDKEYVTLKEGVTVKCRGCGIEHEGNKILYKPKDHYTTVNIPRCPICQSTNLKKITVGSKLLAAGMVGVFAAPYTSKTYECMNCHAKF
jgi:uncharacterized protein with PIN domain